MEIEIKHCNEHCNEHYTEANFSKVMNDYYTIIKKEPVIIQSNEPQQFKICCYIYCGLCMVIGGISLYTILNE